MTGQYVQGILLLIKPVYFGVHLIRFQCLQFSSSLLIFLFLQRYNLDSLLQYTFSFGYPPVQSRQIIFNHLQFLPTGLNPAHSLRSRIQQSLNLLSVGIHCNIPGCRFHLSCQRNHILILPVYPVLQPIPALTQSNVAQSQSLSLCIKLSNPLLRIPKHPYAVACRFSPVHISNKSGLLLETFRINHLVTRLYILFCHGQFHINFSFHLQPSYAGIQPFHLTIHRLFPCRHHRQPLLERIRLLLFKKHNTCRNTLLSRILRFLLLLYFLNLLSYFRIYTRSRKFFQYFRFIIILTLQKLRKLSLRQHGSTTELIEIQPDSLLRNLLYSIGILQCHVAPRECLFRRSKLIVSVAFHLPYSLILHPVGTDKIQNSRSLFCSMP